MTRLMMKVAVVVATCALVQGDAQAQDTAATTEAMTLAPSQELAIHTDYPAMGAAGAIADLGNLTSVDSLSSLTQGFSNAMHRFEPDDEMTTDDLMMKTELLVEEVRALTERDIQQGRGITIKQAICIALQNNTSMKISYLTPQSREWGILGQWGTFDPTFTASIDTSHNRTTTRNEPSIDGTNNDSSSHSFSNSASMGISGNLPTGTRYSLSTSFNRSGSNDNMAWYGASTNLSVTQNLLRGAGTQINMIGIRSAENNYISSLYGLQNSLTTLVTNVQTAYWNLAIGIRALEIRRLDYELSRERSMRTMELVRVGKTSSLDLFSARAEMASSITSLISAASQVKLLNLSLKRLLNPSVFPEGWDTQFFPLDTPTFDGEDIVLKNRIQLAMQLRPDLKQSMLDFDNAVLNVMQTENGLLPSLGFVVRTGFGGDGNTFGRTWNSQLEPDRFNWSAGLEFSRPLQNRSATASFKQSQISRQVAMESIDNLRQVIQVDIRTAVINIDGARAQRESTRLTREQRQKEYEAELAKYEQNRSTQLNVNQVQRDMINSALDELRAQINYISYYLALYQAEGTTLQRAGFRPVAVNKKELSTNVKIKARN